MTKYFYEKGKKKNAHALYFSKYFFDKLTFDYNSDSTKQYEPKNKKEAYKIQETAYEYWVREKLFGWKIAATSKEGQMHIGVKGPMAGRLVRERLALNRQIISLKHNQMKVVEAEFAFKLLNDLNPKHSKYTEEEVLKNVECVYPAIEIPDSRILNFNKAGEKLLIADNACAGEYVIGENPINEFERIDFKNFKVDCYKNDQFEDNGYGSNVLGSPINALKWLVNELGLYKVKLHKGQIVLTGTCVKPFTVAPGDEVLMDFGELGKVSCSFS